MTPIRKVGIIGTGQMGSGIAHVVALSGYDVLLSDLSKERVDKGLEAIGKNLSRQIASGKITEEESKQALARISYAESYQDLADADLVIEAATEDETVKRKIFVALCPFLKPTPSSPPTPRRSPSRGLPPPPTALSASSGFTS